MTIFLLTIFSFTCLLFNPFPVSAALQVGGGNNCIAISNGDTTPNIVDNTDFGSCVVGSSTIGRWFTETTTGGSVNLTGSPMVVINGANPSDFSVTTQPYSSTALNGVNIYFCINFTPQAAGIRTATVSIANDSTPNPYTFTIQGTGTTTASPYMAVTGNGQEIEAGDTTPGTADYTDFGNLNVDGNKTRTFSIWNLGSASLNLTGVSITGLNASDFSVDTQPAGSVSAHDQPYLLARPSTTFTVKFTPSTSGVRTATISIANNDSDKSPYTFDIQGTGIGPHMKVTGNGQEIGNGDTVPSTGDDTDFGSIILGSGEIQKTFNIDNYGNSGLNLTGTPLVAITGADASDFSVDTQPNSAVSAGNSTTFTVKFIPGAVGVRTATISIDNDDSHKNPYTFNIQGTGTTIGAPSLAATASDRQVSLSWTPVADSVSYSVYESTTAGVYGSALDNVAASVCDYDAINLTNGTTYYFTVKAFDTYGNTSSSNEVCCTPQAIITGAPSLTAYSRDGHVNLTWTPTAGSVSYSVYESTTAGVYGSALDSITASVYCYDAINITNGTTYYFTVKAFDFYGNNASSNEVSASPHHSGSSNNCGGSTASTVSNSTGSADVNPAQGGSISLSGLVSATIPNGALQGSTNVPVAVHEADSPSAPPSGFMLIGKTYHFTVNGQDHYQFNKPVTLTFTIDPVKVPSGETPSVYYYNTSTSQWVNLGGTISGNTITVTVDHFTIFAVLTRQETASTIELKTSFTDISSHWAKAAIEKLAALGAASGYKDGTFRPDDKITRAEFITMLVKALNLKANGTGPVFKDTADHWANNSIAVAASLGITKGYKDNSFKPDDLITREEMAIMACKAAEFATSSGEIGFSDNNKISDWSRGSVVAAVNANIMNGYPDNTFRPQGNPTRAEAVNVILNLIK